MMWQIFQLLFPKLLLFLPKKWMNLISDPLSTASIKCLNWPSPVFGRFQNGCNKVVIEPRVVQSKSKFEITRMISAQIALHSVQLPLLTKLAKPLKFIQIMTVSELVMAISGHRSQVRLRNYIGRTAREQLRACSDILSDPLIGRPHQSYGAVIPSNPNVPVNSAVVHSGNTRLNILFSNYHVIKLTYF